MSWWDGRVVLITGASGFLGSWLTRGLLKAGAEVVGFSRHLPAPEILDSSSQLSWVEGSVEDSAALQRVMSEYEVQVVFHLAAQATAGTAVQSAASTFEVNTRGTWALLEACRHTPRVRQIVVASSYRIYGALPDPPFAEERTPASRHPYDVSKYCAEILAQTYVRTYGLPVSITRCSNFYGEGDLNFSRVVPSTMRSVLTGEAPVLRSSGTQVRDLMHVEDGARAHMLLAEKLESQPEIAGEVFNFCGTPISIIDLVKLIISQSGQTGLEPVIMGQDSSEAPAQFLTAAKAERVLGWQPAVALEEGLARTIDWYRDYLAVSS